ncbi:50S ribosomal protein L23 [Halonatronum saccharophilum]|uniref:50S ribosomal protein L23 n=1 Tax=Halonatronum saccharophilum TaxID=150060 RepID=UPI0004823FDE|nr:50S ribosomal protein L23 [Halonatronum saccharophilum]
MKDPRDIIIAPHISERSMIDMESNNFYTFKVDLRANKTEIKKAVEEIFDVKVDKVNTMRVPGKKRRMGYHQGRTPEWKKAKVKLVDGDVIEIFEGM